MFSLEIMCLKAVVAGTAADDLALQTMGRDLSVDEVEMQD